jgi:excisionase family DNA binding protein
MWCGLRSIVTEGAVADSPLLTPSEAAIDLKCSIKTLLGYVKDGSIRYVNVGRGSVKRSYRFHPADLAEFKERRAQRDAPCQPTNPRRHRSGTSISSFGVIDLTALRAAGIAAKQKL